MGRLLLSTLMGFQPSAISPQIFGQDCYISRYVEVPFKARTAV